jgi:hypothetical protein
VAGERQGAGPIHTPGGPADKGREEYRLQPVDGFPRPARDSAQEVRIGAMCECAGFLKCAKVWAQFTPLDDQRVNGGKI